MTNSLLQLGHISASVEATVMIPEGERASALARHQHGDYGNISNSERDHNQLSIAIRRGRVRSVYLSRNGVVFWVITWLNCPATGILLPSDYPVPYKTAR